jgi:hypothetical protein
MKKILIIFAILLIYSINTFAQNDSIIPKTTHYFGINTGLTTGLGISYRYMKNLKGVQFSFNPFIIKSKGEENGTSVINSTVTFIANIKSNKRIDFNFYESQNMLFNFSNKNPFTGVGIGMGSLGDVRFGQNTVLSINIGLALLIKGGSLDFLFLPDFGVGLYYKL